MQTFHEQLTDYYHNAKGAKRKVAEFLILHSEEAAFLTLEQVAKKAGVSPATITRCVAEMGFAGYREMIVFLRDSIKRTMLPSERLAKHQAPESFLGFQESIKNDRENIDTMVAINTPETITVVIDMLARAERIKLFASRTSYGTMSFFAFVMSQIRPNVILLSEAEGRLAEQLLDTDPTDLFVIAALPRFARSPLVCAEYANRIGCKIIAVTDSPTSPLARYADIPLCIPFESYSFFNSNVATLAMYNGLATAVGLKKENSSIERLAMHNALLKELAPLQVHKRSTEK